MVEYVLVFVVLLVASVALYAIYERYFRPTVRSSSDEMYVEALKDLLDGHAETAFTKLRQVVSEDSSNLDAYLRLGRILREHNRPDRALQVHKDLTLRGGLTRLQKLDVLKQLALDYAALGNDEMTQAALKEMVSMKPEDRWAYDRLLEAQKKTKRWDDAYETADRILKIEGDKSKTALAVFKYEQGIELVRKKEYHKARVLFKEALGHDPTYVAAYLAIGDSYVEEHRYEDAVNFWTKLIEAVPSEGHRAIERLKKALFDLGRYGDIAQICEDILKHSPRDLQARLTLAEFHAKKGDLDLAEEILSQIVEEQPDNLDAILELIRITVEQGDNRKLGAFLKRLMSRREKLRATVEAPAADPARTAIGQN
jgi:lipopolysaccharide biosynthesis regulator YciM